MNISVLLKTHDFRGDHSADVVIAQALQSNETIEHAALRLLKTQTDVLEIRLIVQTGDPADFETKEGKA